MAIGHVFFGGGVVEVFHGVSEVVVVRDDESSLYQRQGGTFYADTSTKKTRFIEETQKSGDIPSGVFEG